jgi:iron-sulfur cluster assembly protein
MFKVTQRAATQILTATQQNNLTGLALRLAPQRNPDGSIEYNKMGFDQINGGDIHLICEGIDIIFEPRYQELLNGAIMDFVEIEPGCFSFIFLNPNDPNYIPPTEN